MSPEQFELGEAPHIALARALYGKGHDLPRARALAERARGEYARALQSPIVARELATVDAWLANDATQPAL